MERSIPKSEWPDGWPAAEGSDIVLAWNGSRLYLEGHRAGQRRAHRRAHTCSALAHKGHTCRAHLPPQCSTKRGKPAAMPHCCCMPHQSASTQNSSSLSSLRRHACRSPHRCPPTGGLCLAFSSSARNLAALRPNRMLMAARSMHGQRCPLGRSQRCSSSSPPALHRALPLFSQPQRSEPAPGSAAKAWVRCLSCNTRHHARRPLLRPPGRAPGLHGHRCRQARLEGGWQAPWRAGAAHAGRRPPPPVGAAPEAHQPLLHTNLPRPFLARPAARELKQARAPAAEVATARRQPTTTVSSCRRRSGGAGISPRPIRLLLRACPALPCSPALACVPACT